MTGSSRKITSARRISAASLDALEGADVFVRISGDGGQSFDRTFRMTRKTFDLRDAALVAAEFGHGEILGAIGEILQEMAMQGGGNEALIKRAAKLSDMLRLSRDENAT